MGLSSERKDLLDENCLSKEMKLGMGEIRDGMLVTFSSLMAINKSRFLLKEASLFCMLFS